MGIADGIVSMFRDLALHHVEVPVREAVVLDEGVGVVLRVPDSGVALAGTLEGWRIGVSGSPDGEELEVVVVREGADGVAIGFGGMLRPAEGTMVVDQIFVLRVLDDASCMVTLDHDVPETVEDLLVRAAAGTLLAWAGPDEGGMLH